MKTVESATQTVLVVDDTEPTRYAIARTLKAEGFRVIEAATGFQALALAQTERPDLVTLDIHLPDILGFEVCRRLKSDPCLAHIPVLQVSASFVTSKDRIHGLEGGADSYLTHPFEPAVLIATVKALLRTRELNEQLRLSEERYRVALKNAPMFTYTTNTDLRYTWIYSGGVEPCLNSLLGKADEDVFSTEEARALVALKKDVLTSGCAQCRTLALTLAGEPRHYDVTVEPLRAPEGTITGLSVACIDVTERLRGEEALRRALAEAEVANAAKTRFLSNMSHEIRTPLGIIQGFADVALDPSATDEERRTYLTRIKSNAQSLTKLLGEILDLAKVEAGRISLEKIRFSLVELLRDLEDGLSLQAREAALALRFEFLGPIPHFVTSDPIRVRQVIMNLTTNALKFTEQGGVRVTVEALSLRDGTAQIRVDVSDTGIGIPAEQQAKLFQPFVQADSSTTRRFGGTGLGLNLSRSLARELGGDVVLAESRRQGGSLFTFTFDAGVVGPHEFAEAGSRAVDRADVVRGPKEESLAGMRVLLAEDSSDNQTLFSLYLKDAGVTVEIAENGKVAVEKARGQTFDAILMDLQMPQMDGYQATALLRLDGNRIPIVALTAYALKEERERALTSGFDEYLTKPIEAQLLMQTLARFYQGSATSA